MSRRGQPLQQTEDSSDEEQFSDPSDFGSNASDNSEGMFLTTHSTQLTKLQTHLTFCPLFAIITQSSYNLDKSIVGWVVHQYDEAVEMGDEQCIEKIWDRKDLAGDFSLKTILCSPTVQHQLVVG